MKLQFRIAHLRWFCSSGVFQLKENRVHDVQVIVRNIVGGARNELERLRAVWVWLCHNIGEYGGGGPSVSSRGSWAVG